MTPSFNPEKSKEQTQTSPGEGRSNEELIKTANEVSQKRLSSVEEEVEEAIDEDPTVDVNGREWNLDELPDHYGVLAREQKKLEIIKEKLEQLQQESEQTEPGTDEEAKKYFQIQDLGSIVELQKLKEELTEKRVYLQEQSPDLWELVKDEE